ncbi:MAG: aminotransferase class III-fold pyridoxal phosphate-dependent enzyme [Actinomycetota bacterium]|nr:aminotransferase class III-fold pyridoxal phosphate-dependent enzyme [Actinomycetota bacterium]
MTQDAALSARAAAVMPWQDGLYGHMSTALLPAGYPQFYARGEGARVWDVDGNSYIDLMCSWGAIVLGHRHPAVEAAVAHQQGLGDCLNGPGRPMVELAELLTDTIGHADWAMFAKNGTDATTICTMVARAATGRRYILAAGGAYHGSAPWCTPRLEGTIPEDRSSVELYRFNDLASVQGAVDRCGGDIAGIMVSPFKHDAGHDQELATPEFVSGLRALCDRLGAALILDEVRAGFRLNFGGSWEELGVDADLSAWGKAIANGYPLSAVLGTDSLRAAASSIFVTGSYWYSSVAMAAALATLKTLREQDGVALMRSAGERLRDGLQARASAHGLRIRQSGPPQLPYLTFADDPDKRQLRRFAQRALGHGLWLHPGHNWFLSAAHGEPEIEAALAAAGKAFAGVAQEASG